MKRIRALYNLELYDNDGVLHQIGSETYFEAEEIYLYLDGYCDITLKNGKKFLGVHYNDIENHGVPENRELVSVDIDEPWFSKIHIEEELDYSDGSLGNK